MYKQIRTNMRQTLILGALLLMSAAMQAHTAAKLIKKYRAMPGVEYTDLTDSLRLGFMEDTTYTDVTLTKEEVELYLKNLKRVEALEMNLSDEQMDELTRDLKALKGYEMLCEVNENKMPKQADNMLAQMWNNVMTPSIRVQAYGKVKGDTVSDMLYRLDIWGKVLLAYMDNKVPLTLFQKITADGLINITDTSDLSDLGDIIDIDDDDIVEWSDVKEAIKSNDVLIVINGKEYPDLHTAEEAAEYMRANDVRWTHETLVVGGGVKERYPHTDKKVIIEYSEEEASPNSSEASPNSSEGGELHPEG